MHNVLIVFASVTTANRVKSVLKKKFGIESDVIRAPSALSMSGCSYAVRLSSEFLEPAWNLVMQSGLSSKGAYREDNMNAVKQG